MSLVCTNPNILTRLSTTNWRQFQVHKLFQQLHKRDFQKIESSLAICPTKNLYHSQTLDQRTRLSTTHGKKFQRGTISNSGLQGYIAPPEQHNAPALHKCMSLRCPKYRQHAQTLTYTYGYPQRTGINFKISPQFRSGRETL